MVLRKALAGSLEKVHPALPYVAVGVGLYLLWPLIKGAGEILYKSSRLFGNVANATVVPVLDYGNNLFTYEPDGTVKDQWTKTASDIAGSVTGMPNNPFTNAWIKTIYDYLK